MEEETCKCNKKKIAIGVATLAGLSLITLGTILLVKKRKNEEE